jgi:serine/threonine protein kinase/DNA polymerase III delta prime subunit
LINKDNSAAKAHKPDSYLGNYRLIRLLGHGGFAAVFLGEHRYLQRLAAIKVLRTILTENEKAHFLEEARLLANLSHPHIVRVLEFEIAPKRTTLPDRVIIENIPFLVMDYVSGGNLRSLYPPGKTLPLDRVITYVKQVADALEYAHQKHIIHRDIKPENLLLNERQEIMLSDFGLALFAPQNILLSRQSIAGTLPYTAPEQLRGKPTFASDQYSLGIVAYEWLSGYPPFLGGDAEVIMHHVSSPPPSLRSKNPSVSPAIENVILKALAKESAQRYPSILAFAQALEQANRTPRPHTHAEAPLVPDASLQPPNVFPFFYYFSQKPDAAPQTATNQGNGMVYPLAMDMQLPNQNPSLMSPSKQRNRQRMIQKVRAFWITGVLDPSLHNAPFIRPELREKQDAVARPWAATLHHTQQQSDALTSGSSITEVYDQAGGELLILGEAGSGKTTLLLQLARDLLARAEQDMSAPIPVVFPLCSWAEKQLPIDQWLLEELTSKYQVPRLLGGTWLRSEIILPLLDGLDEVTERVRSSCIIAINAYKQEHGLSQLVVCSRLTDYLLFPPRVQLQRAIVVQSLSIQQVHDYFLLAGRKFQALSEMLSNDALLYGLITTPLMLNIIMLAYQDKSPTDLLIIHSPKERYGLILDTYVDQMLQRHPTRSISKQDLVNKLTYIARKMLQSNQFVFYIEKMQPQWIDKKNWQRVYMWLATLLPGAIIGTITGLLANILLFHAGNIGSIYINTVYGTIMGYLFSNRDVAPATRNKPSASQPFSEKTLPKKKLETTALFVGLITFLFMMVDKGWLAALANGLLLAILSLPIQIFLQRKQHTSQPHKRKSGHPRQQPHSLKRLFPPEHLQNGAIVGIACGLTSVITLLFNHMVPANSLIFLLTLLLRDSVRNILLGILLSTLLAKNNGTINCTEIISWSWKKFFVSFKNRNIFYDLLVGTIIGILFGTKQLFQGNINMVLSAGLSTGVLITIGLRLISAFMEGISSNKLNNHDRVVPNAGIKNSLSYGLISFVIGTSIITFFTIVTTLLSLVLSNGLTVLTHASKLQAALHTGLIISLLLGPTGGLLAALLLGWLASWQHAILRLILYITRALPLNLSGILDYATDCLLLRKMGGSYIFIHRALMEYFATACAHKIAQMSKQPPPPQPEEPLARPL